MRHRSSPPRLRSRFMELNPVLLILLALLYGVPIVIAWFHPVGLRNDVAAVLVPCGSIAWPTSDHRH